MPEQGKQQPPKASKTSEKDELTALRRHLHKHPEASWDEINTSEYILSYFHDHCPADAVLRLAKHGIAFVFNGHEPGKTVLIRTELDALHIHETNTFDYKSITDGVSHKCGHDGHMAMVTGTARHISKNRPKKGRVIFLFQPAEETGEGGRAIYEDRNFHRIRPDMAFSLHNVPGKPMHQILCKPGPFTPSVKSMIITLAGKTAHAAQPATGINPGLAVAKIIQTLHDMNANAPEGSLITLIHTIVGEKAYGVSAGYGEVHLTMRGESNEDLQALWDQMTKKASEIAQENSLEIGFEFTEEFMANTNSETAVQMIRNAAKEEGLDYVEMDKPNPWGEDFGFLSSNLDGAMFGLGSGTGTPDLHNPDYDFPDELIETGIKMFTNLIRQALH